MQRAANRVRVTAQLIDARTDTHLWVDHYDRPLDDVFAIQSDIAKAIATQLQAKLSPAEKSAIEQPPTKNLIAYDCYLRARKVRAVQTARVPGDMREETRLLDQAVAYDPKFLLAYCELAQAHAYAYHLGVDRTPARVALAKAARDAALRLSSDRGEPHLAAAEVAFHCNLDYDNNCVVHRGCHCAGQITQRCLSFRAVRLHPSATGSLGRIAPGIWNVPSNSTRVTCGCFKMPPSIYSPRAALLGGNGCLGSCSSRCTRRSEFACVARARRSGLTSLTRDLRMRLFRTL